MNNFSFIDRLISALTYFTFGVVGIIWLVVCAITRVTIPKFTNYHIMQSIFLSIILYLITFLLEIGVNLTVNLPIIGEFVKKIVIYLSKTPIYFGFSLINYVIFLLISYLALFALFGKYSYFPYISETVKNNLGER